MQKGQPGSNFRLMYDIIVIQYIHNGGYTPVGRNPLDRKPIDREWYKTTEQLLKSSLKRHLTLPLTGEDALNRNPIDRNRLDRKKRC